MAFSFENYERNENLKRMGFVEPKINKTGTTIVGIKFKDGVVLGADTRSTAGMMVASKNTVKIHYLADHMYCCGAGTSADTDQVTKMISSQLELHRLLLGTDKVPAVAATKMLQQHLFQYQGHIGAALILGCVDHLGSHIFTISPNGTVNAQSYSTMGSGCLAAGSVLETRWKPNMELEEAKKLVRDAIAAGVYNDLGSGNTIDLCVITKDRTDSLRFYEHAETMAPKDKSYRFKPKSTAIISRTVIPIKIENTIVRQLDVEPMEVL